MEKRSESRQELLIYCILWRLTVLLGLHTQGLHEHVSGLHF